MGSNSIVEEARSGIQGIHSRLDRAIALAVDELEREHYAYQTVILQVGGAATSASGTLSPLPGTTWLIQQLAATGDAAGFLTLYLNEIQPQTLLFSSGFTAVTGTTFTAAASSTIGNQGLVVPENQTLVALFTNQPNNKLCTLRLGIVELELSK